MPLHVDLKTGQLVATVSPAFYGGGTTESSPVHINSIPAWVVAGGSSSSLSFGPLYLNETLIKSVFVHNYRSSTITITDISTGNSNFVVTNGVNQSVLPNSDREIKIQFKPATAGNFNDTIQIATSGGDTSFPYTGTGVSSPSPITAEPSLNFGTVYLTKSASQSFKVHNYTGSAVTISSISTGNGNFVAISGANQSIGSGSYVTATVKFRPTNTGNFNGTVQINTAAGNATTPYSGIGANAPRPVITTSASGGGTITQGATIDYEEEFSVTMTPSPGYKLGTFTDNGQNVTSNATYNAFFAGVLEKSRKRCHRKTHFMLC